MILCCMTVKAGKKVFFLCCIAVGHVATHAVVVARLVTLGHDHGIHPFIVQVRSLEDHTPLPGMVGRGKLCRGGGGGRTTPLPVMVGEGGGEVCIHRGRREDCALVQCWRSGYYLEGHLMWEAFIRIFIYQLHYYSIQHTS